MASNFPTSLDDFANYVDGTTIMEAATLNDMQFAIEALEAKVGIDSSAVTTSHDYKLANLMTPGSYAGEESVTFPNGLILKQGIESVGVYATDDVVYGTAFPNGIVGMQATVQETGVSQNEVVSIKQKTGSLLTTAQIKNPTSNTVTVYWQVWGY